MTRIAVGLSALLVLSSAAAAADYGYIGQAAAWVVPDYYAPTPSCYDGHVLGTIIERHGWAERNTWYSGIAIAAIDRIAETPNGGHPPGFFYRRYCRAVASLNNGDHEHLFYRIEYPAGFAGTGWNVTFCLPGYDRWHIYGSMCRSVRPP